jgi:hypothetical protein
MAGMDIGDSPFDAQGERHLEKPFVVSFVEP